MLSPTLQMFANGGKVLTVAEPEQPTTDGSILVWLRSDTQLGYDGSNYVFDQSAVPCWKDQSGHSNDFAQSSTSHKCVRVAAGLNGHDYINLDPTLGLGSYIYRTQFIAPPVSVYILARLKAWTTSRYLFSGEDNSFNEAGGVRMVGSSPSLTLKNGATGPANSGMTLNTWHVLTAIFNGASSIICVDKGADATGDAGSNNLKFLEIGHNETLNTYASMDIAALIISGAANGSTQRLKHVNWLSWYGGLGL